MNPITKSMNLLRSYTMRAPMWLRLLVLGLSLATPVYWAITDSGFYHLISDWQAGGDGTYNPVLSFMLCALFFMLPALAVMVIIGAFFPEKKATETDMGKGI